MSFRCVSYGIFALCIACSAASAQPKKKGLLDGLDQNQGVPPSTKPGTPPGGGAGGPICGTPGPTTPFGGGGAAPAPGSKPTPASGPRPAAADDLAERIRKAEAELERLKGLKPGELPPIPPGDGARAREILEKYRKIADKMGPDVAEQDRARMEKLRERERQFHDKFDRFTESILNGEKPQGISAIEWARVCDEFYTERAKLDASLQAAERRLKAAQAEPSDAQRRVKDVEQALEKMLKSGQGGKELAEQLNALRISLMEQRVRELKQLQEERAGKESRRDNASTVNAYVRTGDWYIDSMNYITRQIELMGRAGPPADSLADGLAIPEWLEKDRRVDAVDRLRAKVRWLSKQMDTISQQMADAKSELITVDDNQLKDLEAQLKAADKASDPNLTDPARARARAAKLAELKAEQDRTRQERTDRRREFLRQELDNFRDKLAEANAALDKAQRDANTPR